MKLAWGITGAGHYLRETFEVFKKLKKVNTHLKITTLYFAGG